MAKKDKNQYKETAQSKPQESPEAKEAEALSKLPEDVQEKLTAIKSKLEKFQKKG